MPISSAAAPPLLVPSAPPATALLLDGVIGAVLARDAWSLVVAPVRSEAQLLSTLLPPPLRGVRVEGLPAEPGSAGGLRALLLPTADFHDLSVARPWQVALRALGEGRLACQAVLISD